MELEETAKEMLILRAQKKQRKIREVKLAKKQLLEQKTSLVESPNSGGEESTETPGLGKEPPKGCGDMNLEIDTEPVACQDSTSNILQEQVERSVCSQHGGEENVEGDDEDSDLDDGSQLGEDDSDMCLIHQVEEIDLERFNDLTGLDDCLDENILAERLSSLEEKVGRLNTSLGGLQITTSLAEDMKRLRLCSFPPENATLTCAPNPVPLHIALKNDLQVQELHNRLRDITASSLAHDLFGVKSSSEITRMSNESPGSPHLVVDSGNNSNV